MGCFTGVSSFIGGRIGCLALILKVAYFCRWLEALKSLVTAKKRGSFGFPEIRHFFWPWIKI